MTGVNAALIVQAEAHILNARRELYIAMDRLRELENRVSPTTAIKLGDIRIELQRDINALDVGHYQGVLHALWTGFI